MTTAYLAAEGFADQLQEELRRAGAAVTHRHERLFLCDGAGGRHGLGRQCLARLPWSCRSNSIGSAADALRAVQRNWALYAHGSSTAAPR